MQKTSPTASAFLAGGNSRKRLKRQNGGSRILNAKQKVRTNQKIPPAPRSDPECQQTGDHTPVKRTWTAGMGRGSEALRPGWLGRTALCPAGLKSKKGQGRTKKRRLTSMGRLRTAEGPHRWKNICRRSSLPTGGEKRRKERTN